MAKPILNIEDPLGFFTTVANRMLREYSTSWFQSDPTNYLITYYGITPTYYVDGTGSGVTNVSSSGMTNQIPAFGIANIPVLANGQFVYTPAVQRVLQLAANIYDASTTNFYPTVFRPLFQQDNLGNVFIIGYTNLSGASGFNTVSGAGDSQLAQPYDIAGLGNLQTNAPITDASGLVNVYGVPWIIGAKKGFPNFNEFSMQDMVKVTRKLQVTRQDTNSLPNATNQMYVISVTNSFGVEFWNSYTNTYTNQVQLVVNDNLTMQIQLTNDLSVWSENYQLNSITNAIAWPGNVFVLPFATSVSFLPNSAYQFSTSSFNYVGNIPSPPFEFSVPAFPLLPQMLLLVTNELQVFMLDNNHVIDYVHFSGPGSSRNLTAEFQNTNTPSGSGGTAAYYSNLVWSTALMQGGLPLGIATQVGISAGSIPLSTLYWNDPNAKIEIDGFRHFLNPLNQPLYNVQNNSFYATNLAVQVPYSPTAITYEYTTYQANDPLVHYLKSDLSYFGYDPDANSGVQTGVHPEPVNVANFPVLPDLGKVNARYMPWGKTFPAGETDQNGLPVSPANVDQSLYNLAFKDPLMSRSDNWDFPSGSGLPLLTIGRVHRGTPWQTVYLKASDILPELNPINSALGNVGTNTWAMWTDDANHFDAVNVAPVQDRLLIGLLIPLMETNLPANLLSVNATALSDWSTVFDGIVALTNTTQYPQFQPLTSNALIISPASPALGQIVSDINNMRSQFKNADGLVGTFEHGGDILATPQLTEQSPFLNTNNTPLGGYQLQYGISDEMYEAIPAQLLPLLRTDSIGKLIQMNNEWDIKFSGSDGFTYALQTSTNLVNWNYISTNCPVQGYFIIPMLPVSNSQFYRSVLLP